VHRYNVTGLVHDMWGFPSDNPKIVHGLLRHLVDKIENNAGQMARYRTFYLEDAETVLVSFGSAARSALHIVETCARGAKRSACWSCRRCGPFRRRSSASTATGQVHGGGGDEHGPGVPDGQDHGGHPEHVFLANRIDGAFITPRTSRTYCA
jgi:2-oxoglutarate ferredoxin oxidoreductase subunit alpha